MEGRIAMKATKTSLRVRLAALEWIEARDRPHEETTDEREERLKKISSERGYAYPMSERTRSIVSRQYQGGPIDYNAPGGGW